MNRKGEPNAFLISIIIILVTLLLILFWLYKEGYLLARDSDYQLCKLTIQTQDKTKTATLDSPLTINCKRRYLRIEPDKTVQYDPTRSLTLAATIPVYVENEAGDLIETRAYNTENLQTRRQVVNSVFAESMRRCWDMVGQGQRSIFNDQSILFPVNTCLICDQITVAAGSDVIPARTEPTLPATLSKNMPGSDPPQKYQDFLFTPTAFGDSDSGRTLSGGKLCLEAYNVAENFDIPPGTYATVAFHSTRKLNPAAWATIADWAGIIPGEKYECQNVYVVPSTKLRTLCDYVAN